MILLILIGLFAGLISGMGIGGGMLLIPALTIFFQYDQKVAQNVNLLYFIPTAIIALITHFKNKNIEKALAVKISAGGIIGAVLGAVLALNLESGLLKKGFGILLLVMGLWEIFKKQEVNENAH